MKLNYKLLLLVGNILCVTFTAIASNNLSDEECTTYFKHSVLPSNFLPNNQDRIFQADKRVIKFFNRQHENCRTSLLTNNNKENRENHIVSIANIIWAYYKFLDRHYKESVSYQEIIEGTFHNNNQYYKNFLTITDKLKSKLNTYNGISSKIKNKANMALGISFLMQSHFAPVDMDPVCLQSAWRYLGKVTNITSKTAYAYKLEILNAGFTPKQRDLQQWWDNNDTQENNKKNAVQKLKRDLISKIESTRVSQKRSLLSSIEKGNVIQIDDRNSLVPKPFQMNNRSTKQWVEEVCNTAFQSNLNSINTDNSLESENIHQSSNNNSSENNIFLEEFNNNSIDGIPLDEEDYIHLGETNFEEIVPLNNHLNNNFEYQENSENGNSFNEVFGDSDTASPERISNNNIRKRKTISHESFQNEASADGEDISMNSSNKKMKLTFSRKNGVIEKVQELYEEQGLGVEAISIYLNCAPQTVTKIINENKFQTPHNSSSSGFGNLWTQESLAVAIAGFNTGKTISNILKEINQETVQITRAKIKHAQKKWKTHEGTEEELINSILQKQKSYRALNRKKKK